MRLQHDLLIGFGLCAVLLLAGNVSAQVDPPWVRYYDGPDSRFDESCAIGVDDQGNIYVSARSDGAATSADYLTIKYNADGDTLWTRRYDGPANNLDAPMALKTDDAGFLYVTGTSIGTDLDYEIATLKYNTDGDLLWVRRHHTGEPAALDTDAAGHVYVIGKRSAWSGQGCAIKYSPDGDTLWERTPPFYSTTVQVDGWGNVYVSGSLRNGSHYDFATIKYSAVGDSIWMRVYDSPSNDHDQIWSSGLDGAGNLYVTGSSVEAVFEDFLTIKYCPDGDLLWIRRDNPGFNDRPTRIELDSDTNIYVTGTVGTGVWFGGESKSYFTIKYSHEGDSLWARQFDGEPGYCHFPAGLAIDSQGEIHVTGTINRTGDEFQTPIEIDIATVTYNAEGEVVWIRRYNDSAPGSCGAADLVQDGSGNIYITGQYMSPQGNADCCTIKYPADCDCPYQSDFDEDEFLTPLDLSALIDILYVAHPDLQDETCPSPRADFDCDGFSTALDLGRLIDHLFVGGDGPCDPCSP